MKGYSLEKLYCHVGGKFQGSHFHPKEMIKMTFQGLTCPTDKGLMVETLASTSLFRETVVPHQWRGFEGQISTLKR